MGDKGGPPPWGVRAWGTREGPPVGREGVGAWGTREGPPVGREGVRAWGTREGPPVGREGVGDEGGPPHGA